VTWMAWRLQRSVFLLFVVMAVVLIGFVIANGLHTESLLHQWNSATCYGTRHGYITKSQVQCGTIFHQFAQSTTYDRYFAMAGGLLCGVLGLLLGVNLVASEIDRKTVRTAWTQSITRTRWLSSKIIVSLGSLLAVGLPLCFTHTWWIGAVNYGSRVAPNAFAYDGWMPLMIGVFAFALTTVIGVLLRRPGWTIAAALIAMVLVMWTMQGEVRANLVPLRTAVVGTTIVTKGDFTGAIPTHVAPKNSWIVFQGYEPLNSGNALLTRGEETRWGNEMNRCETGPISQSQVPACQHKLGLRDVQLYVANNEFWTLQLREGAIYLAGAAFLFELSLLLVRRTKA